MNIECDDFQSISVETIGYTDNNSKLECKSASIHSIIIVQ